jgi:hypothetical protein
MHLSFQLLTWPVKVTGFSREGKTHVYVYNDEREIA